MYVTAISTIVGEEAVNYVKENNLNLSGNYIVVYKPSDYCKVLRLEEKMGPEFYALKVTHLPDAQPRMIPAAVFLDINTETIDNCLF